MDAVKLEDRTPSEIRLSFHGRVDSQKAAEVSAALDALLSGFSGGRVVLDCSGLEYISSAGLRIFLRLKKSHSNIHLAEVSNDVY
ncbi:MAG: STAS domain-containing protein, partial [Spirochaetales bacterium]|nr:STAS domain-containing protein [Spirochaetales bacterium]